MLCERKKKRKLGLDRSLPVKASPRLLSVLVEQYIQARVKCNIIYGIYTGEFIKGVQFMMLKKKN